MRWLLLIIVLLAAWWFFTDPEPIPVEETYIGEPVRKLREAEAFEEEYLDATAERQKAMEEALEAQDGD